MVAPLSHGREGQHLGIRLPGCFWVPGTQLEMQLESLFTCARPPNSWPFLPGLTSFQALDKGCRHPLTACAPPGAVPAGTGRQGARGAGGAWPGRGADPGNLEGSPRALWLAGGPPPGLLAKSHHSLRALT